MTLKSTLDEFLITQQLRGNSEKTIEYYSNCVGPLVKFAGYETDVLLLDDNMLKNYSLELHNRELSD